MQVQKVVTHASDIKWWLRSRLIVHIFMQFLEPVLCLNDDSQLSRNFVQPLETHSDPTSL